MEEFCIFLMVSWFTRVTVSSPEVMEAHVRGRVERYDFVRCCGEHISFPPTISRNMKAMVIPNPEVHRRKIMKRTVHFSVSLVSLKL